MATKEGKYAGMAWINPYLYVKDVDRAIDFYKNAFGFEVFRDVNKNEHGVSLHCELSYQGEVVMIGLEAAFGEEVKAPISTGAECPISLYLYCSDVDQLFLRAKEAGAIVIAEPEDQFWGDRMCRLKDPNGYLWSFATYKGDE